VQTFIYSNRVIHFIQEIKCAIRDILSQEVRIRVERTRFYDRRQTSSYPISVVIYNDKNLLGYFDPNFYELGFHERLMHESREQLYNVIRHELAHYITFINYGREAQPHGAEFKRLCQRMGWGEEVDRATLCLEGENNTPNTQPESGVFRKVQKLMALATSSNAHEAEQAMIKSQQLLLKHNAESQYLEVEDGEKIVLKRILKQKKKTAKMCAVAKILETFFVSAVYHRSKEHVHLEILGEAVNVEIAEYVAAVLHTELDHLWNQAQQKARLKGTVAKNSFFLGLAKGYCNKVQALKQEHTTATTQALMVLEKKLTNAKAMVYGRLSSSRSYASHCHASSALGEQMGRQLHITPSVRQSSDTVEAVTFRK
jgi:hypothetical protein